MPSFVLNTNVASSKITPEFLLELTDVLEQTLQKPRKFYAVHVNGDQNMIFGGTAEPCGLAILLCIGKLGVEENKAHTKALMDVITEKLGIPADRMYIQFTDIERENVGWNGTTFAK